jgi:DNA-directed RNA polymerase specialized sigma24 family protein
VTTRLAIDRLRSARAHREVYPGEWLPEPLVDDEAVRHAGTADSLSLAFLHLLEKLSATERAVFLLREVFDYPYDEVARIVGKRSRSRTASSSPSVRCSTPTSWSTSGDEAVRIRVLGSGR